MGYAQGELAQLCDISQTALSQIEAGLKSPSDRTIKKVCKVMEVPESLIYILAMQGELIPQSKEAIYKMVFPLIQDLAWQLIPQGALTELRPAKS